MAPKIATRSCLEQIAIIDALIARNEGATRQQLAEACGCSARTISRHMVWMRDVLGVEPTRLGYGPHRIFVWAHNQEPIFSRGIGRRMRERVQLEEVGR